MATKAPAQKKIQVGVRSIDVTGLNKQQQQKVIDAAKNGAGSKASEALAREFRKKVAAPQNPSIKGGGGNQAIQDPNQQVNVNGQEPGRQTQLNNLPGQTPEQLGDDANYQPSNYNPGTPIRGDVTIPEAIGGVGQNTRGPSDITGTGSGVDNKTGAINVGKELPSLQKAEHDDVTQNFNTNNPGTQVDPFGNRQDILRDPDTGNTKIVQTAGGPLSGTMNAFQGALGSYTSNFNDAVSKAQNANYNYQTRNLQSDKAQELEAKKQELAQRGIPIDYSDDPNKPTLWQKSLNDVDRKYQGLTDQANNQAIMQGNETLGAQVGAQNSILGSLTNTAQAFKQAATPFVGANQDMSSVAQAGINSASGANLQKYQIDKQLEAAKIAASKAGGGGGAPAPKGPVFNG